MQKKGHYGNHILPKWRLACVEYITWTYWTGSTTHGLTRLQRCPKRLGHGLRIYWEIIENANAHFSSHASKLHKRGNKVTIIFDIPCSMYPQWDQPVTGREAACPGDTSHWPVFGYVCVMAEHEEVTNSCPTCSNFECSMYGCRENKGHTEWGSCSLFWKWKSRCLLGKWQNQRKIKLSSQPSTRGRSGTVTTSWRRAASTISGSPVSGTLRSLPRVGCVTFLQGAWRCCHRWMPSAKGRQSVGPRWPGCVWLHLSASWLPRTAGQSPKAPKWPPWEMGASRKRTLSVSPISARLN